MTTDEQKAPTVKEIAARILAHLQRFEADKREGGANWWVNGEVGGRTPYYDVSAGAAGRFVRVCYVLYQGGTNLPKVEALAYLAWLDAGNVGKHWRLQKEPVAGAAPAPATVSNRKRKRLASVTRKGLRKRREAITMEIANHEAIIGTLAAERAVIEAEMRRRKLPDAPPAPEES